MQRVLILAAAALLPACAAVTPPEQVVRDLYAEDNALAPAAGFDAYFARDLAAALNANAGAPGDVGTPDFDYRFSAQDVSIDRLRFHEGRTNSGMSRVVARFDNIGEPEQVVWNLCERADGEWRIADAGSDGDTPWTLRNLLAQPASITC